MFSEFLLSSNFIIAILMKSSMNSYLQSNLLLLFSI